MASAGQEYNKNKARHDCDTSDLHFVFNSIVQVQLSSFNIFLELLSKTLGVRVFLSSES